MTKPIPEWVRELLNADESATMAGVAKRTWWRYVGSGRAPQPVRVGGPRGVPRWRRTEILAWIESGCPRVVARKGVDE
jgi:predicted DNA-binding transcriptional regulator AlpA